MDTPMRLVGLFAIIPTTMLLIVSFFVLFAVRKLEEGALKTFGCVLAVLLWISASLVLSAGLYTIATGQHPLMPAIQQMMQMKCPMMDKMMNHPMMNPMMNQTMMIK